MKFDTHQREAALRHFVQTLHGESPARLLDVGGFPGGTRSLLPEHDIVIVDRIEGKCPQYAHADGAALPFPDNSFDACFCLDVLEHVPKDRRPAFLREMARVARDWVLVIGPFDDPGVEEAERAVSAAYEEHLGRTEPWLSEHRAMGLPDRDACRKILEESARGVAQVGIGNLANWTLFMLLTPLLESLPHTLALDEKLDALYTSALFPLEGGGPSYRSALIAGLSKEPPPAGDLALPAATSDDLRALPMALAGAMEAFAAWTQRTRNQEGSAAAEYVRRLEETVADLEAQVGRSPERGSPKLEEQRPTSAKPGFLARLLGE